MATSSQHSAIAPGVYVTILLVLLVTVSAHFNIEFLLASYLSPEAKLFFDAATFSSIAFILTTSLILLSFQPWRRLAIYAPSLLSSHMHKSSWTLGGGQMQTVLDVDQGKVIGLKIRWSGRVFGIEVSVEEIATERNRPYHKMWETTGTPRALVIGHYRIGFDLSPKGKGSLLRVLIEYALPERAHAHWLGRVFGRYYARWCTQQMIDDAVRHFAASPRTYHA